MNKPVTRREFFKTGSATAVATGIAAASDHSRAGEILGPRYEADIPQTLDLAERAALAVNALTGSADPEHGYETYHGGHLDQRPPYLSHGYGGPCTPKPVDALPMMRLMSGSTLNQDFDGKMLEWLIRDIDTSGLWWLKTQGAPWRAKAYGEDFVCVSASGRLMVTLRDWYRYDRNPLWLELVKRMGYGLARIAIRQGDAATYCDFFDRSGFNPKKSWNAPIYVVGYALRGFTACYELSGDKMVREMAASLARTIERPAMIDTWKPPEGPSMVTASEHAHWEGHFHSHTMGMIGLIEYANAVNNSRLKEFVASFYEYSRSFGFARIGFFPAVIAPVGQIRPESGSTVQPDEGCAVADMILLAVLLSDGGAGDYWDDVDQYVRNHLVEHQIVRRDLIEQVVAAGPVHRVNPRIESARDVIDRQMGAFITSSDPTLSYPWWTMCCLGNCSVALYRAWESILRFNDGTAQVNLLLNRASPWLDVDSYLPYEGKVVLRNKRARRAYVRVPLWVNKRTVRCRLNQKDVPVRWLNNYLVLEALAPGDVIAIEFPVVETTERHTEVSYGQRYTCRFRGNTLVEISPRAERPAVTSYRSDDGSVFVIEKGYPLYLRSAYSQTTAPIRTVWRHVTPVII